MIEIHEAYQALCETVGEQPPLEGDELVATSSALGRVLAEPVACRYDNPPFSQSAMDGIAFRHEPDRNNYRLLGTVAAGDPPDQFVLDAGDCVRIMTGAPVPQTADTVEMVEKIKVEEARVTLCASVTQGQHIRPRGENARRGEPLYDAGTLVSAGILAGLITQGRGHVRVKRRLRVGIAATGDEIINHYRPLQPGQIYNSNGPAMSALLASPALEIVDLGTLPDSMEATRDMLAGLSQLDVIVLSGGVSMGNFDMVPDAASAAGFSRVFHKIAMKPGKPVWFGRHERGTLLFGMPGNPVSVLVGTLLYVRPTLAALLSGRFQQPLWAALPTGHPLHNHGRLTLFMGVSLVAEESGTTVHAPQTSGSGDILRFSRFQTLCRLQPGAKLKRGENVEVLLPFQSGIS